MKRIARLCLIDYWPYAIEKLITSFRRRYSTFSCKITALWWGVSLGKQCQFFGKTYFRRMPKGKIRIGYNCVFRSAFWSNTIGLKQKCFLSTGKNATISTGNNCGFSGTIISANERIKIGNNVLCGANVTITDFDRHPVAPAKRRDGEKAKAKAILIEDDVWLGMNVVVLKGVTIGCGSVIAANSVVTKSIPPMVVAAGIPAKKIYAIQCKEL